MSNKKILMITGDFRKTTKPWCLFSINWSVGHTVHAVCPDKKSGIRLATRSIDFEGDQTYTEKPGSSFRFECQLLLI